MANRNLKEAKAAKNDEFYTQYHDIEAEMNAYLEYNPNVFRGKTILLPCDDPEWSTFKAKTHVLVPKRQPSVARYSHSLEIQIKMVAST